MKVVDMLQSPAMRHAHPTALPRAIVPWIGLALGAVASVLIPASSWDGLPASPVLSASSAVVALGAIAAGSRVPRHMLAWTLIAIVLTLFGSFALGSSWAFLTWIPLFLACVLLARMTPWFFVGMLGTIVIRDASTLVLLSETRAHSGSVQYFVAFASAALLPALIHIAVEHVDALGPARARWSASLGLGLLAGLCLWAILISGSRAAFVGGLLGIAVAMAMLALTKSSGGSGLGRAVVVMGIACVSVVPIDLGLSSFYGDGRPLALNVFLHRAAATASEVESEAPGSISTRFALWRQAARILVARPVGHGPASYGHVNHAYQTEPLLWSGSPHNMWALAAVETGALGMLALGLLVLRAFMHALRRSSVLAGSLVAATVVMSLDVFASMPAQSIVWWAAVGSAIGRGHSEGPRPSSWQAGATGALTAAIVALALLFAFRLASPCGSGCNPVVQYGGNPQLTGPPRAIAEDPGDPTWDAWATRYPLAFWRASARAAQVDTATGSLAGTQTLLRDYPFQSLERYVVMAVSAEDPDTAAKYAQCGLARFFGDAPIWRDWRSSSGAIEALRAELERLAQATSPIEAACVALDTPQKPIGLR